MIENPNPGPWKLVSPERGWPDGDSIGHIEDANGNAICDFGDGAQYYPTEGSPPGEPAATLMLAAPELEALLRRVTDAYEGIIRSDRELSSGEIAGGMPPVIAESRALLARFEAARAEAIRRARGAIR